MIFYVKSYLTMGLRGNSQTCIRSFLTNCRQYVSINGFDSYKLNIKCGVPQGSTLGPLLFSIYKRSPIFASHFADDACISYTCKKLKTLEMDLNHDL